MWQMNVKLVEVGWQGCGIQLRGRGVCTKPPEGFCGKALLQYDGGVGKWPHKPRGSGTPVDATSFAESWVPRHKPDLSQVGETG
jgi:hypothetical protein